MFALIDVTFTFCSDMLSLGASKPWPDAMEALTGQRHMLAQPMLEYFKPLMDYLDEELEGDQIGWSDDACEGVGRFIMFYITFRTKLDDLSFLKSLLVLCTRYYMKIMYIVSMNLYFSQEHSIKT